MLFFFTPDIILILASVSTLAVGYTQEHFYQAVLGGLRFFQILRMVRMDRKGSTWKLLGSVVWAHRQVSESADSCLKYFHTRVYDAITY